MGDFMHGARNPIRERDERIATLETLLRAARTEIVRVEFALRRLTTTHADRLVANIDKVIDSAHAPTPTPATPLCASTDCWLCHGVPPNAGPR